MGKRKGKIEQIFSKAIYSDNPELYLILYRDFNTIISVTLPRFMEISENLQLIPITRIVQIRKGNEILYQKFNYLKEFLGSKDEHNFNSMKANDNY